MLLKHSNMGHAYEILHLSLHLGFIRYDRLTEALAWLWIKEVKQAETMRWIGYLRRLNVSASFLLIWFVSYRNFLHVSSLFIGLLPFTDLLPKSIISTHQSFSSYSHILYFYLLLWWLGHLHWEWRETLGVHDRAILDIWLDWSGWEIPQRNGKKCFIFLSFLWIHTPAVIVTLVIYTYLIL